MVVLEHSLTFNCKQMSCFDLYYLALTKCSCSIKIINTFFVRLSLLHSKYTLLITLETKWRKIHLTVSKIICCFNLIWNDAISFECPSLLTSVDVEYVVTFHLSNTSRFYIWITLLPFMVRKCYTSPFHTDALKC